MENLNEDTEANPLAALYGKDDVLPIDDWRPRKMSLTAMMTYSQMVAMTELMLKDLRTWAVQTVQEKHDVLQICVIMLHWGAAQTADESFFLACWIQAWSEMSWVQLRANLWSAAMLPRLSDLYLEEVPALDLMVGIKVPLILCNAIGQTMGE